MKYHYLNGLEEPKRKRVLRSAYHIILVTFITFAIWDLFFNWAHYTISFLFLITD